MRRAPRLTLCTRRHHDEHYSCLELMHIASKTTTLYNTTFIKIFNFRLKLSAAFAQAEARDTASQRSFLCEISQDVTIVVPGHSKPFIVITKSHAPMGSHLMQTNKYRFCLRNPANLHFTAFA